MSWIQKLSDTYDQVKKSPSITSDALLPVGYINSQVNIEVCIDGSGEFLRARVLEDDDALTPIPCTEGSAGRAGSRPTSHSLCDKLQYVAGDFDAYGGAVTSGFKKNPKEPFEHYIDLLARWCGTYPDPLLEAVLAYVKKERLIRDLVAHKVLPIDTDGMLVKRADKEAKIGWPIWKSLVQSQSPEAASVRWVVESVDIQEPRVWKSQMLQASWAEHSLSLVSRHDLCMASGIETSISSNHPKGIRYSSDKAKLISANDGQGFTFRGRFTDKTGAQACGVGSEVTQKAHNALAWLIARQGVRTDTQVFVCWAVSGASLPKPLAPANDIWAEEIPDKGATVAIEDEGFTVDYSRDAGQRFALKLRRFIKGYADRISPTEDIVVMGLDAATPGRMSIIYYRELLGSEFLERLEAWHWSAVWWQRYTRPLSQGTSKNGKTEVVWRVSSPSPKGIAETAFGLRLDDSLKKATVERLVPCIIDGRQIPWDLVARCVGRVSNRVGMERWAWEKSLGIACALYRGFFIRHFDLEKRREYSMALDDECTNRDYLYGRLLAIAEHVEGIALYAGGESRPTTAERLMQRFSDRPFSTWLTIEKALQPYMQRLHNIRPGFLVNMNRCLDDVHALFDPVDYTCETRLSGEYLLGYHCQRRVLKKRVDNA